MNQSITCTTKMLGRVHYHVRLLQIRIHARRLKRSVAAGFTSAAAAAAATLAPHSAGVAAKATAVPAESTTVVISDAPEDEYGTYDADSCTRPASRRRRRRDVARQTRRTGV